MRILACLFLGMMLTACGGLDRPNVRVTVADTSEILVAAPPEYLLIYPRPDPRYMQDLKFVAISIDEPKRHQKFLADNTSGMCLSMPSYDLLAVNWQDFIGYTSELLQLVRTYEAERRAWNAKLLEGEAK